MRPPEPISGLVFLPKYRIRFDDGSELVIPSVDGLEQRVRRGEIRPDTVIFDAGRGIWCRAGEAPVVRSILDEIGPEPLPGWSGESDSTPAFAAVALDVPTKAADAVARPRLVDEPLPLAEPDRFRFATHPAVARASAFAIASRIPLPVTTRGRVAVTSLVGGASLVALGFVFFQDRDVSANDVILLDPGSAPTTPPVNVGAAPEISSAGETPTEHAAPPPTPPRGSTASQGLTTVGARAAESAAPSTRNNPPRALGIPSPSIPFLTERQIASNIDTSGSTLNSSPMVALPVPSALSIGSAGTSAAGASVPFTQAPRVLNAGRIQQALERQYPIGLRALGVGGRVELAFYINEQGDVERYEVRESSLNADLDRAALAVAQVFEFAPALRGNERVATWFTFGVTFGEGSNGIAPAGANAPAEPSRAAAGAADQPVATRFDMPPRVSNSTRVRQALDKEYPNALRDSGIGGKVEVWFYVNEEGGVDAFQLKQSSNITALDQAALRVAQAFEFTPGATGGEPSAGWVSVGITFNANAPGGTIR